MAKILVVDDDAMNQKMAEMFLKKAGHDVEKASSGEAGIELLKGGKFDLMLLDIEMPGKNGFETLEEIRNDASLADQKVCFLSGDVDTASEEKAKSLGAIDFIKKPFMPADLMKRVADALS